MPDSGPTVASRTAMVVGGLVIEAARRLRGRGRGPDRAAVRRCRARDDAREHGDAADRRALHAVRRPDASTTRPTPATPTRRSAGRAAVAEVEVDLDTGEVTRAVGRRGRRRRARRSTRSCARARSRAARCRRSARRRSRRSSCSTAATSTTAWQTYIIPTSLDAPRIETILVEAPFERRPARREGRRRAADGRRGAGGRRRDPRRDRRLDRRPAGDARADPGRAGRDRAARRARRVGGLDAAEPGAA